MRMRRNKSVAGTVNSAGKQHRISLCLHQAAGFVWDTRIPASKPLADLHRTAVTSPNMVQAEYLALDFVTDKPPSLPLLPFW